MGRARSRVSILNGTEVSYVSRVQFPAVRVHEQVFVWGCFVIEVCLTGCLLIISYRRNSKSERSFGRVGDSQKWRYIGCICYTNTYGFWGFYLLLLGFYIQIDTKLQYTRKAVLDSVSWLFDSLIQQQSISSIFCSFLRHSHNTKMTLKQREIKATSKHLTNTVGCGKRNATTKC